MDHSVNSTQAELSVTAEAVEAAHHATLDPALQTSLWERRGLLQRLMRTPPEH